MLNPLLKLYEFANDRWHAKAERKALLNKRYAELAELYKPNERGHTTICDHGERTLDKYWEKMELFNEINPIPWWISARYWLDKNNPSRAYRQIKWFIQRGKRGYADGDVWNFDSYLSSVIIGGLKDLRKNTHGYPSGLTEAEWDETLARIIEGFSQTADDIEDRPEAKRKFNNGFVEFRYWFHGLWD